MKVPPRRQIGTAHAHRQEGVPPRVRRLHDLPREQPLKARKLHVAQAGDVRVRKDRLQEGQLRPRLHLLIQQLNQNLPITPTPIIPQLN